MADDDAWISIGSCALLPSARRGSERTCKFAVSLGIALLLGCAQTPTISESADVPPELSRRELERRLAIVRDAMDAGEEEHAADLLRQSLEERLDVESRRDVLRALAGVRRSQFWRDNPLHAAVRLDSDRYCFGESMHLEIALTNLGANRIEMRANPTSLLDRWTSDEHAMIDLTLELTASDLAGARVVDRRNLPRIIENDIVIEPGGTATLDLEIPLIEQAGAVFAVVAVSAVLRPLEITAGESSARYGALNCGGARARVERTELARWMRGGIEQLRQALAPGADDRAIEILLAIGGLEDADLKTAMDELSGAAESLAGPRRRLALACVQWLLGPEFTTDTIGLRTAWLANRDSLDAKQLGRLRLGGERAERSLWAGGSIELASLFERTAELAR